MRLTKRDGIFFFQGNFEDRHVPKAARFWFDGDGSKTGTAKIWFTRDPAIAANLAHCADDTCSAELECLFEKRKETVQASRATDADIEIPIPDGLDYMPFQRAGIQFAIGKSSVLLADEPGLGKTIQAVGVINYDAEIRTVLAIVPASLKLNWKKESLKWLVREFDIYIAEGTKPNPYALEAMLKDGGRVLLIVNYDIAAAWGAILKSITWDLLLLDEAHMLKTATAARTKAILGAAPKKSRKTGEESPAIPPIQAKRRIFATGTPVLNRPEELWTLIHSLDPTTWPSWWTFVHRYCGAHRNKWGLVTDGATNIPELQEKLRATIMIRRRKEDVLTELPPKRRQIIEIPANGYTNVIREENEEYEDHENSLTELRAEVELAKASDDEDKYTEAVARLREAGRVAFEAMARIRHQTALAKVPAVIEHLTVSFESTPKIVCFAHHRDVVEAIAAAFPGECVVLYGGMSATAKDECVTRFQDDPTCKLFVGSIQAAGVGLTLTAASTVVFAELSWTPALVTQAEDRCHRIGAKGRQ